MKLSTTRFGDIDIDEGRIIRMKDGMLGFEQLRRYVLIPQDRETPFMWFQSVDDGSLAFVVIHSFAVKPDYEPVISDDDVRILEIESLAQEDLVLLSVVTIRPDPFKVTVNLRAPIVVNSKKMLAKQIVLTEGDYEVQYPLTDNKSLLGQAVCEKRSVNAAILAR